MSNSNVEMKKNIDDFYKENLSKINKGNVKLILISFLVLIPMTFIKYGMQTKTYIGVAWLILCAGIIMCINKIVKQNEKKAYSILLAGGISAAIYSFLVGGSSNAYVVVLVIVFISAMYFSVKITLISTVPMVAISVILSIIAPYTVEGPGGETIAALSKVAVMGVCIYLIKDAIATGARINKSSFEGMIKLQEENEKTAEIVKELNNVVEESNNIVNDLVKQSASIDDVSKKIIEDATVITNGVSNVNLSVRTVRENIDKDSELSGEVNEKYIEMVNVVNDGVLRVNDTKEIMAVMEKAIRDAYVVTDDLKENMVEIDAILDEIDDIFSQTKLLALNASIEAARAGEKGKGFEVVADEIRGLSDESTTASRNIKQIISVLNDTVDEVATKIKYGSVVSSKGYEEMDSITNILQGINETSKIVEGAIEKEHELIENIAKEFIKVANEMESVSALSEENISMLEDIENNIDKENQSINDLEGKMEYVESIAKTLE